MSKNRKWKIALLATLVAALVTGLCACGGSPAEPDYADKAFIKDLGKGLEARWAISDSMNMDEVTIEDIKSWAQTELDRIEKYESSQFEDSKLQEKAIRYINCLKESQENAEAYLSENSRNKWDAIYNERTALLKDFVENYGLTVSSKNQANLDELVANGKDVAEENTQRESIDAIVQNLKFKERTDDDDSDFRYYEAVFENTTDYDLKWVSIELNLLDKEGVIISTESVYVENAKKGQKTKLEFMTDKKFKKIDPTLDSFEIAN